MCDSFLKLYVFLTRLIPVGIKYIYNILCGDINYCLFVQHARMSNLEQIEIIYIL